MDNYQYQQYLESDEWKQKARQRAEKDELRIADHVLYGEPIGRAK